MGLTEIQRVRAANAKGFLNRGDDKKALRLIYLNLNEPILHLPTFSLLAEYYIKKSQYKKAQKVYLTALKKAHGNLFITIPPGKKVRPYIQKIKHPSHDVLMLIEHIAIFYEFAFKNNIRSIYKPQLLSLKYYSICQFFQHNLFQVNDKVVKIKQNLNKDDEVLSELISIDIQSSTNSKQKLLLAESFIKKGQDELGMHYLRNSYRNSENNPSIKQYARTYLDSLNESSAQSIISIGLTSESNLHKLTDSEISQQETIGEEYGSTSGIVQDIGIQTLLNKSWNDNFSTQALGSLQFEKSLNSVDSKRDSRILYLETHNRYHNLEKILAKINYSLELKWERELQNTDQELTQTTHSLTPEFSYNLKAGIISYQFLLEVLTHKLSGDTKAQALGLGFSPHYKNKLIDVYLLLRVGSKSEFSSEESSTFLNFSGTNISSLPKDWSLLSTLEFHNQSNIEDKYTFLEIGSELTLSYSFQKTKGLVFETGIASTLRSRNDGESIKALDFSLGLSYSL